MLNDKLCIFSVKLHCEICQSNLESTLAQVMAWCRQAPSHYLSHCWSISLSPYEVARGQWVNKISRPQYMAAGTHKGQELGLICYQVISLPGVWRPHGMETPSASLAFLRGKSISHWWIPMAHKRPVLPKFDIFFVVSANKLMNQ